MDYPDDSSALRPSPPGPGSFPPGGRPPSPGPRPGRHGEPPFASGQGQGAPGQPPFASAPGPFPPGPPRIPPRRRHRFRIVVLAVVALLVFVAIGLVIETALGPKPKQNLTPPTPVPVPTGSSPNAAGHATPGPTRRPTLSGPIQLIQGAQLVNGVYLGFPDTTVGAVSAADEFMSQIGSTLDPDRAAAVLRLTADPSYPAGPQDFASGTVSERTDLGLPATGPLPSGTSAVLDPVEYQVRDVTASQVTVLLLADDVLTLPPEGTQTRVGVYPLRMHWAEDDWKILPPDGHTTYAQLSAVPGTPQAADLGWQEMTP